MGAAALRQFGAPFLAGSLLAAAFPKLDLHVLVWFALAPLLVLAARSNPWVALRTGFLFGFAFRGVTMYWVVHAMTLHGGLPWPAAVMGAGLLAGYMAAYWGLFALVVQQVGLRGPRSVLLIAVGWAGLEFFQGWFLTGFPWTPLGYAAGRSDVMIQTASLAGVAGLSFLAVLVNGALASWWLDRRTAHSTMAMAGAFMAAALVFGVWSLTGAQPSDERLKVGLVQGNVPQDLKWDAGARRDILERHVDLTRRAATAGADLVLWPESSWPDPYGLERDPAAQALIAEVAAGHAVSVVVGTVRVDVEADGYEVANAAVLVDPQGAIRGAYEKSHLVPFGEYLPFQSLLRWLGPLVSAVGDMRAGAENQALLGAAVPGLPGFGMSICYEVIFPAIARGQVDHGARFLATITNDAWYGTTSGPYQHHAMARMRAVENRRWLVRAANTGISGAFDPWGREFATTALEEASAPVVDIGLRSDTTLYGRMGDALGFFMQVVALVLVAGALRGRPFFERSTSGTDPV
ncbi:MAG: apolipoprotein N-acyltransferase [Acidobacteria bacterium]|nr:apolipoprotein N-acyltransferase [Acidobacteriota bacterium]